MPIPARARRLRLLTVVAAGALLAAPADAALPAHKALFKGTTSQNAPIQFKTSKSGRKVYGLEVGSAGPPPSGIVITCNNNPNDTINSRVTIDGSAVVSDSGKFKFTAHVKGSLQEGDFTLRGQFTSSKRAEGKFHLDSRRFSDNASCQSGKVTFVAKKQ